ncbi:diaminopimelate epimerase [Synechococcus sp. CCY9202]|uniref:diaminopimelate epimerase n=1 Tax=Synechococcus sp. CCY9202 TaxID=174698 RepID=UPI002B1F39D1|nr:diaminopimelate epimerase [Synechococcus sp. CCY9202]MEA5424440.1 diaminopimelate epimerase [Synechococcus sp. CCY9202]
MLQFSKYQGLGNDFLMLDGRNAPEEDDSLGLTSELVRRLCDRRFGVGGDGVILALPPGQGGELRMRIFNADGTEPEMCGNGIRCLARFLADSDGDQPGRQWQIETLAGRIVPELQEDGTIRVDMGRPLLDPEAVPTTLPVGEAGIPQGDLEAAGYTFSVGAAGMGNPHVVIPVTDVALVELDSFGAALEVHPAFPARTNVHFVQVLSPTHLVMRVWERGAGPTLACGTGACATLVVCHRLGLSERRARLDLPGGPLEIDWDEATGHLFMTGPAEAVFDGVVAPALLDLEQHEPDQQGAVEPAPAPRADSAALEDDAADQDPEVAASNPASALPEINCAVACVNGCVRPDACPSAEARARVAALLESRSLDDLVAIATNSLDDRTRARIEANGPLGG